MRTDKRHTFIFNDTATSEIYTLSLHDALPILLLFSGGKDSIVMLELARKAFAPARIPFPVMHVDTGLNFPDVLQFRDRRVAELGVQLIVASVPDAIAAGTVKEIGRASCRERV